MDIIKERLPNYVETSLKERIEFKHGNFYELSKQFPNAFFSGIFVMNNLMYLAKKIGHKQHSKIAREFNLSLREGGYLCISGFGKEFEEDAVGQFGVAVFQKHDGRFREIFLNNNFKKEKYFGDFYRAYI